jgi:hypothetical protein
MIFQIFSPKKVSEKMAFLTKKTKIFKILIITLVFEKNANFFAENCQKSQKIVIITSTPDWAIFSLGSVLKTNYRSCANFWFYVDLSHVDPSPADPSPADPSLPDPLPADPSPPDLSPPRSVAPPIRRP